MSKLPELCEALVQKEKVEKRGIERFEGEDYSQNDWHGDSRTSNKSNQSYQRIIRATVQKRLLLNNRLKTSQTSFDTEIWPS